MELAYLEPTGRLALGLRLVRKTVGQVPPGPTVRLFPAAGQMLVGAEVATTLSAIDRSDLPGWALMAANVEVLNAASRRGSASLNRYRSAAILETSMVSPRDDYWRAGRVTIRAPSEAEPQAVLQILKIAGLIH